MTYMINKNPSTLDASTISENTSSILLYYFISSIVKSVLISYLTAYASKYYDTIQITANTMCSVKAQIFLSMGLERALYC